MTSVAKLSKEEYELLMKYKGKIVSWKHPMGDQYIYGKVIGIQDGFLLAQDNVATEGILESWIADVYGG